MAIHESFLCEILGHGVFWWHQQAIRRSFLRKNVFSTNSRKVPAIQYYVKSAFSISLPYIIEGYSSSLSRTKTMYLNAVTHMNQPPPHRNSKCTVLHVGINKNGSSYIYPSNIHSAGPNPEGDGGEHEPCPSLRD